MQLLVRVCQNQNGALTHPHCFLELKVYKRLHFAALYLNY